MKRIAIVLCLLAFASSAIAQSPQILVPAPAAATKVLPVPQAATYQTAPAPLVYQAQATAQAPLVYQAQAQAAVLYLPGPSLPQPAPCAGNCPQPALLATSAPQAVAGFPWHPLRKLKYILKYR